MDNQEILSEIDALFKLESSTVGAYDQAINKVTDIKIHTDLQQLKKDHQRHITALSGISARLGGDTLAREQEPLAEGFKTLNAVFGTKAALEAMRLYEKLTNKRYRLAGDMDFPEDIKRFMREYYIEEQRHLALIESALNLAVV
jgi:rubrerythrin